VVSRELAVILAVDRALSELSASLGQARRTNSWSPTAANRTVIEWEVACTVAMAAGMVTAGIHATAPLHAAPR
jgi:hypothetical protein